MRKSLIGFVICFVAVVLATVVQIKPALGSPAPSACGKNLLVNPSFEDGPYPGSYLDLPAGSTTLGAWAVTKGSVDLVGGLWPASDGHNSIDLDGVSFGAISQTFDTTAGKTYVVSFDLAANGYGAPAVKRMQISAASQTADFQYDLKDKPYGRMGWQPKTWSFVAKAASTTLAFTSLDTENGYFGPVIDNVRAQAACD